MLSIDWGGVKEYTGSSGWFTSVDLAVAAALSVFVLGGSDALSLDNLLWRRRLRHAARDDGEPGFRDNELDDSRRRLQGEHPSSEYPMAADQPRTGYPAGYSDAGGEQRTEQLPEVEPPSSWNAGLREREGSGEQDHN